MTVDVHKAILYWNPSSVWSTVPRLALAEKGYGEDDVILREVDIRKGENFSESYLRLNKNGTIPTLVVPLLETTGPEMVTQYRSFKDTMSILAFLDSSRTPSSNRSHGIQQTRPAPSLSPATIEAKHLSDSITLSVHLSTADPNFLLLAARTAHELLLKDKGAAGEWVRSRQAALIRYRDMQPEGSERRKFLQAKLDASTVLYDIYTAPRSSSETDRHREEFFHASTRAWQVGVVEVLKSLEESMIGPYVLGDQLSLADLHLIAWLTRIVFLSQGSATPEGLEEIEKQISGSGAKLSPPAANSKSDSKTVEGGGDVTGKAANLATFDMTAPALKYKIGPKIRAFWAAWIERDSFKTVYLKGLL